MPDPPVSADGVHVSEARAAGVVAARSAGVAGAVVSHTIVRDADAGERLPALSTDLTV